MGMVIINVITAETTLLDQAGKRYTIKDYQRFWPIIIIKHLSDIIAVTLCI